MPLNPTHWSFDLHIYEANTIFFTGYLEINLERPQRPSRQISPLKCTEFMLQKNYEKLKKKRTQLVLTKVLQAYFLQISQSPAKCGHGRQQQKKIQPFLHIF